MKKYFILLAIVLVGCKWRYDKVVKPEAQLFLYIDSIRPTSINGLTLDSLISSPKIWPACTGATIHMHNNLDSGKGYIFRKYQNKLPKKHIIIDLSSGVK